MRRFCFRCRRQMPHTVKWCRCLANLVDWREQLSDRDLWSRIFGWGRSEREPTASPDHARLPPMAEEGFIRQDVVDDSGWTAEREDPRGPGDGIIRALLIRTHGHEASGGFRTISVPARIPPEDESGDLAPLLWRAIDLALHELQDSA